MKTKKKKQKEPLSSNFKKWKKKEQGKNKKDMRWLKRSFNL